MRTIGWMILAAVLVGCAARPVDGPATAPAGPVVPSAPAEAEAEGAATPLLVVERFRRLATEGQIDRAEELLVPLSDPVRPDELRRKLAMLVRNLADGRYTFAVAGERIDGNVALVVIEENVTRYSRGHDWEPMLLVRRPQGWRILLDGPREHGLSEEQLRRAEALRAWFEQEKARLERGGL